MRFSVMDSSIYSNRAAVGADELKPFRGAYPGRAFVFSAFN